jgi:uncharacterized membrane protein YfcA
LIFAGLMILASYKMIKEILQKNFRSMRIRIMFSGSRTGSVVGVLTGLVGAGGGFMIIPALVNLLKSHENGNRNLVIISIL